MALLNGALLVAAALVLLAQGSALSADEKPIQKVVNLLKDMQSELEKEQDEDEDLYDAFTCWCEANDKAKTKAIAEATQRISDLGSTIEMLTAKGAQLTEDIATLKGQIAENTQGLEEATALRAKEAGEFHANELDSTQAIGNLKAAVVTLGKHHEAALSQEQLLQLQQVLKQPMAKHPDLLRHFGLAPEHRRVIASLLQQSGSARAQAPQSGAIFGIMKQMKESFETNLVKAQKDEDEAVKTFNEMKTAKSEEIAAGTTQVDNKSKEKADADSTNEESKEDLADTQAQLEADQTFLADVKTRCAAMDKQFAERTAVRQDEVKAVSEALEILTDDDAKDLMSRSTSLLQVSSTTVRSQVAHALDAIAKRFKSSQIALLATSAKEDVFAKVKESIDTLIAQLKTEQKDEVEKKDWCRDNVHKNEMDLEGKYEAKEDVERTIANHDSMLAKLKSEIQTAKDEITQTNIDMKRASENRMKANTEFQNTVADQRATQEILAKALGKLKGFYSKKAALLQTGRKQNPLVGAPPPDTFQPYKKKGGAGGVMGMIENIVAESKQVESEAKSAEQAEQEAYESFMKDSAAEISTLQQEISDKTARVASADGDLVRAKEDLVSIVGELEDLTDLQKELHGECDYVMENFETRQEARTAEMEALEQAKQLMSGMAA